MNNASVQSNRKKRPSISLRKKRKIREYLTAYAFIAPAVILIFIFGIFPVGFALYVSLHKWRLKQGDFLGLGNYVKAIDDLAYVGVFLLGIGALAGIYFLARKTLEKIREEKSSPWLLVIPGIFTASTIFALLRYFYVQLPEIMSIADKVRGLQKTQALFIRMLGEAFMEPQVQQAWWLFVVLLVVTIAATWLLMRNRPRSDLGYLFRFSAFWLGLGTGLGLLYFTFTQIQQVYAAAIATETDPGIWPHVITIMSGVFLLLIGWFVWRSTERSRNMGGFWLKILVTMILLVGGWLLIAEIPMIVSSGDEDLWSGLKVTLFFSLGTVPFQLAISLFLSILLFQKLVGSNLFRILFFLPYVTPAIASAAIFRQMFSNRATAPMNMLLRIFGGETAQWLYEPEGVFSILANGVGVNLPSWMDGPSLALVVIIIHSIWTYVGYDTVIYLAGLGNIPKELIDAAEVDGASRWEVFRYITFPLLSPTTYFLSLMAIIGTFKAFNTIWMFRDSLALGTVDTFSVMIFVEFFDKLRYGYASALSFILFAIILSLTYINNKVQGSRVFYG